MGQGEKTQRRWVVQATVISLLVLMYGALAAYFHLALRTNIVYTHFVYLPIVLAGMWWGRKGVFVAAVLATVVVTFHILGIASGELWSDVARISFFFVVAVCTGELSERVKAGQEARRISEEKYRMLIDKSLTAILVYRDDRILFANPRFSEILGYHPTSVIGKSIWELIYEDDKPRVQALVERRKAQGFSDLHYECRLVRKDGTAIWADVSSSVTSFEGEPAVLVNAYDISDRKEAEEKRRELSELARKQQEQLVHSTRLAELGEMAAAIAHELNQPLTGIRNFARNAFYMLEKHVGSTDEVKGNLRLISEQVDRASRIINQMRELTRREERQFRLVNINAIIRESIEFLTPQLKLSGVEVALSLADNLPPIMADKIRLEQVFLNLLTNARQAMEDSEQRHLTVRTYLDAGNESPVVTEVEDTGRGFAAEDAEKLFRPFFSTKKAGHGTGLGLSISLSIIKDHNGAIDVVGAPGKGAKFTVRLPLSQGEDEPDESRENG